MLEEKSKTDDDSQGLHKYDDDQRFANDDEDDGDFDTNDDNKEDRFEKKNKSGNTNQPAA